MFCSEWGFPFFMPQMSTPKLKRATVINSQLYSLLYEEGGDCLIAVYSILKFYKRGEKYKKSGYKNLKNITKLSITTLKSHIPTLIKLGLCKFENGDFILTGNRTINNTYKNKSNKLKFVPIQIGTYKETQLYSFRVRIMKMEQTQKNKIDYNTNRSRIITALANGKFINKWESKILKSKKKYTEEAKQTDKIVLSNQGYYLLKSGKRNGKASGNYWKQKLIAAKIIKTRRVQDKKYVCSKEVFESMPKYNPKLFHFMGCVYEEKISEFTTTTFPTPDLQVTVEYTKPKITPSKKLDHLSFDVIHWWTSNPA